jgi:hypothetical protein
MEYWNIGLTHNQKEKTMLFHFFTLFPLFHHSIIPTILFINRTSLLLRPENNASGFPPLKIPWLP